MNVIVEYNMFEAMITFSSLVFTGAISGTICAKKLIIPLIQRIKDGRKR